MVCCVTKAAHHLLPCRTHLSFRSPVPAQVKRCYMRANLLVHPDKVSQKGGSLEQVVTADIAFDILKVAW